MAREIYFHIWNNHFKMWGYDCYVQKDQTEIALYWGRIGQSLSDLQQKRKIFSEYWDAYDYIKNKVDDKLRKGYVAIKNSEWTKYVGEETSLSDFIKLIEEARD